MKGLISFRAFEGLYPLIKIRYNRLSQIRKSSKRIPEQRPVVKTYLIGEAAEELRQRIKDKVCRVGDCWIWTGTTAGSRLNRYPVFEYKGTKRTVRQVSYLVFGVEPALGKSSLRPKCGNALCVNPKHLKKYRRIRGGRPSKRLG